VGGDVVDQLILQNVTHAVGRELNRNQHASLLQNIRRVKESLAAGGDRVIELPEEFQKTAPLTNEIVNEVAAKILEILRELLEGMESPEEIELIGGGTRLPSFTAVIQSSFPIVTIRRSLNSNEAVAIGTAYYTSLQTGTITGTRIEFHRTSLFGLRLSALNQTFELFERGQLYDRKFVSLRRFRDFNFSVMVAPEKGRLKIRSDLYHRIH
jgi:molecular chaperone DnaK (HSP70)